VATSFARDRDQGGRIKAILAAKAAIETEAREKAAAEARAKAEAAGNDADEIERAAEKSSDEAVRAAGPSETSPIPMPDHEDRRRSFHYCYNAQAVVDEAHQVIIATSLTQAATDIGQLVPMMDEIASELESPTSTGHPDAARRCRLLLEGQPRGRGRPRHRRARRHRTRQAQRTRARCTRGPHPADATAASAWRDGFGRKQDAPTTRDARRSSSRSSAR